MAQGQDKEILKKIGDNLKKIRTGKGLSLRALSHRCSIDFSDIGKIERGENNATVLTLNQLAEALEIPLCELFRFEPDIKE